MNRSRIIPLFLLPLALFSCASPQVASSSTGKSEPSITVSSTVKTGSQPSSVASADQSILVKEITLNKTSITLQEGESFDLVATISPANATNKKLVFSSGNKECATVSQNGRISAVAAGYSLILVVSEDGNASASCYVRVQGIVTVSGVKLNKESVTLEEGKTLQLYETVSPSDANNKQVSWTSSNPNVADVSSSGLVSALSVGEATITVTTADGGFTATCAISVVEKENFSYEIGYITYSFYVNESSYLKTKYLHLITPVTNTGNVNIYLSSATYDIYDSNDNPLMSINEYFARETPSILAPGETGYFTVDRTYDLDVVEGIRVTGLANIKNAKNYNTKRYTLSNITFSVDKNYGVKATGKVKNDTSEEGSTIDSIHVVLFDQEGKYCVTLTCLLPAALAPGQEAIFEATSLYDNSITDVSQIGNYVAYGEFLQFVY